ncbi:MAG TPA: pitrilysin family protein [Xanthobacteraceae bacterium]|nr:pitrilysin family protein [Xanthobacteraceae bacterium]
MKRRAAFPAWRAALLPLAGLFLWLAAVPANAVPIERIVSPLGIEAWLVRELALPLVTMQYAFRGGASQDPAGKPGVSTFASGLLDEGAGNLDSKAFHERLESRAIEMRFSSGRDVLQGSLRTLSENRDEAANLLRLALTAPRFDATAVERVRGQLFSDLRRESTNPRALASLRWWAAAFPNHPYGRPVNGTLESVAQIGVEDLRAYIKRVLARDNLKIAIVGDIDAVTAGAMIDRIFGALPAKAELAPVSYAEPQALGRRIDVKLDVPQANIVFGGVGIARKDPDFMAAYVVDHIVGGGTFSSRLYNEVREKRGLAYSVGGSLVWLHNAAVNLGSTATRSNKVGETLQVIDEEIRRMAESGPTAEELKKAKAYLKGSFALNLDTSRSIASALLQIQLDDLGIDYIDKRNALIDAVTLDDAKRVAKRLLDGKMLVSVVGRTQGGLTTQN